MLAAIAAEARQFRNLARKGQANTSSELIRDKMGADNQVTTRARADHNEFMICTKNWTNETVARSAPGLVNSVRDLIHRVQIDFELIEEYECLGILVVRSDKKSLEPLLNHPGCVAIAQFLDPISFHASTMRALECVHNQSCYQAHESRMAMFERGLSFPNGRYEGGIFPPGEYPIAKMAKHTEQPRQKLAAFPALLPVVNLSFGPSSVSETSIVNLALARLSETHLITVAAGNSGLAKDHANINSYAPDFNEQSGIICVGAANATGTELAGYSSTGVANNPSRRPCLVANGENFTDGICFGTSFAAPRVATLACLIFDAVMQVHRIANSVINPDSQFGIPLVGWGIIDEAEGEAVTYARRPLDAMPFIGPRELQVRDTFEKIKRLGISPWFSIHGPPVRTILLRSARPVSGRKQHEVGCGCVSRDGVTEYLSELQLGEFLKLFCEHVPTEHLTKEVKSVRVFDRNDLEELFRVAGGARPIWIYDMTVAQFFVNSPDGQKVLNPPKVTHALRVALSGRSGHE